MRAVAALKRALGGAVLRPKSAVAHGASVSVLVRVPVICGASWSAWFSSTEVMVTVQ